MKIKKITKVKPRTVYAITTSTGTFISDGLAHHNCRHCNTFLEGNTVEYIKGLKKKYGDDIMDQLEYEKSQPYDPMIKYEYQDKIDHYKKLVKEMKKERGIR